MFIVYRNEHMVYYIMSPQMYSRDLEIFQGQIDYLKQTRAPHSGPKW